MEFWILLTVLIAILRQGSLATEESVITVTDKGPCLEGNNHTLTCKLKKRRSIVRWIDGNDAIVQCEINKNCSLNPPYKEQYNFSYNPIKNEIDLIILKVDKTYNGKMLVCSDGTNFSCKILHVSEYEQSMEKTENGTVTATSACSSNRNFRFKWIKIDASTNQEVEFKPKILSTYVTFCSNKCGNSTKYTEVISIATSGDETKYNVKMTVVYGTERAVSENQDEELKDKRENLAIVIVVIVAAFVVAVIFAIIILRKQLMHNDTYSTELENDEEENEPFTNSVQDLNIPHSNINDEDSANQEVRTNDDNQNSDVSHSYHCLNENHGNDAVDMDKDYGVAKDTEILQTLHLLEEREENDAKMNEMDSANHEFKIICKKGKEKLETADDDQDSYDMHADPNFNHCYDSFDMNKDSGVAMDTETLQSLHLLEGKENNDIKDTKIHEEDSANQEFKKGKEKLKARYVNQNSDDTHTVQKINGNHSHDAAEMKQNCGNDFDEVTLKPVHVLEGMNENRIKVKKSKWTEKEIKEIKLYASEYLAERKTPSFKICESFRNRSISENGVLHKRSQIEIANKIRAMNYK